MPKILIIVQGGLVSDVYSDMPDLEVRLVDTDIEDYGMEIEYEEFLEDNNDLVTDRAIDETKILKQYPHNNY